MMATGLMMSALSPYSNMREKHANTHKKTQNNTTLMSPQVCLSMFVQYKLFK